MPGKADRGPGVGALGKFQRGYGEMRLKELRREAKRVYGEICDRRGKSAVMQNRTATTRHVPGTLR